MRNSVRNWCACLLIVACAPLTAQRSVPSSIQRAIDHARATAYPALVNITVVFRYFEEGRALRDLAGGSGVIISRDGYVVTNFHVAGHTTRITCTLSTGEQIPADVVTDDPLSDLSILKLELNERQNPRAPLHWAQLGNSDTLRVGDFVLAMGNPLMLSSSMTLGIVSNTHRVFTDFAGTQMEQMELEAGERTGMFTRWIQHDALILPGNSGGPLVNLQGQVVGINELGGSGMGFAIPSNVVRRVLDDALRYHKVRRGWLGVTVYPVAKMDRRTGALVSAVMPNSPAARAGVAPGDILLSLGGEPTNVRYFEQVPSLLQRIAALPAGLHVSLRLLRGGKPVRLTAVVAQMPDLVGKEDEFRGVGMTGRNLTQTMALEQNLSERHGVVVTGLRPGYPLESAQPHLEVGDVIRAVNGKPTPDIVALRRALASAAGSDIVVSFSRKDERMMTVAKHEPPPSSEEGGELPKAWIGVKTEVLVPEIARALGAPNTKGFLVTQVYPWTAAARAGLKPGDMITAINGNPLDSDRPQDSEDFRHAIEDLTIGANAQLTLLRNGKTVQAPVLLEAPPASAEQGPTAKQDELEFTVREINLMDRAEHHWARDQVGVMVTEAVNGGWANVSGLRIDDLIVSMNGRPVTDVASFKSVMRALLRQRPKIIDVFVRRDALTRFVFIEPDWNKLVAQ